MIGTISHCCCLLPRGPAWEQDPFSAGSFNSTPPPPQIIETSSREDDSDHLGVRKPIPKEFHAVLDDRLARTDMPCYDATWR